MRIFALEGNHPHSLNVVFSPPILFDDKDKTGFNTILKRKISKHELELMGNSHLITEIDSFVEKSIDPYKMSRPQVLRLRSDFRFTKELLEVFASKGFNTIRFSSKAFEYILFRSEEAINSRLNLALNNILKIVLSSEDVAFQDMIELINAGLLFEKSNPHLNALRVFFAPPEKKEIFERIVYLRIEGSEAKKTYDEFLNLLQYSNVDELEVVYENGVAEAGLEADDARAIFGAISALRTPVQEFLAKNHPYLPTVKGSMRFVGFAAASAHIKFSTKTTSGKLGDKLIRTLEIKTVNEWLRGGVPADLKNRKSAEKNIGFLSEPSSETVAKVRYLNEPAPQEIKPKTSVESNSHTYPISVFAFHNGSYSSLKCLDFKVNSKKTIKAVTISSSSGKKKTHGLEWLDTNDHRLFRPAILDLRVTVVNGIPKKYELTNIRLFEVGGVGEIFNHASTHVDGFISRRVRMHRTETEINITDNISINLPAQPSKQDADKFLRIYDGVISAFELNPGVEITFVSDLPSPFEPSQKLIVLMSRFKSISLERITKIVVEELEWFKDVEKLKKAIKRSEQFMTLSENGTLFITDKGDAFVRLLKMRKFAHSAFSAETKAIIISINGL